MRITVLLLLGLCAAGGHKKFPMIEIQESSNDAWTHVSEWLDTKSVHLLAATNKQLYLNFEYLVKLAKHCKENHIMIFRGKNFIPLTGRHQDNVLIHEFVRAHSSVLKAKMKLEVRSIQGLGEFWNITNGQVPVKLIFGRGKDSFPSHQRELIQKSLEIVKHLEIDGANEEDLRELISCLSPYNEIEKVTIRNSAAYSLETLISLKLLFIPNIKKAIRKSGITAILLIIFDILLLIWQAFCDSNLSKLIIAFAVSFFTLYAVEQIMFIVKLLRFK